MRNVVTRDGEPCCPQRAGARRGWLAFLAFAAGSVLLMLGMTACTPDPSGQVALVYRPGMSAAEAFTRAAASGARPVRLGRLDWILVVAPLPDDPGFAARAYAEGALAILNPWVAGGCSPGRPFNQQRTL